MNNRAPSETQSRSAYLYYLLAICITIYVIIGYVYSNGMSSKTTGPPTLLQAQKLVQSADHAHTTYTHSLSLKQRADLAWQDLEKIPIERLVSPRPITSVIDHEIGLIGSSISRWQIEGERAGFKPVINASRPTLQSRFVNVILNIREGIILGAEVHFIQDQALSAGPEWSRIVNLLVGSVAIGGPDDPMMMLDQLHHPDRVKATSKPQTFSGIWEDETSPVRVEYYLLFSDHDSPLQARLWLIPRDPIDAK